MSGNSFLALTGTADVRIKETIKKDLTLKKDTVFLDTRPERSNITCTILKTKREDHLKYLQWLIDMIREKKKHMPKTIF